MRPEDQALYDTLTARLRAFEEQHPLPGISAAAARESFMGQLIESVRRIRYTQFIRGRNDRGDLAADSRSDAFDPLKAAIIHQRQGSLDEAFWLVFLSIHFGKHKADGWRLMKSVYGGLATVPPWTWQAVTADPASFRRWFAANEHILKGADGTRRRFGNHRKYESLNTSAANGTVGVIESYLLWVNPPRSHTDLVSSAQAKCDGTARKTFAVLYRSMGRAVRRFGRTALFDYLSMLGKLGLARIEPDSAYLTEATGPLTGAMLLFTGSKQCEDIHPRDLDKLLIELDAQLDPDCGFGLQVLEDAICNWQKSPNVFRSFRG